MGKNKDLPPIDPRLAAITLRIIERSRPTRSTYLQRINAARDHRMSNANRARGHLSCANQAHVFAGAPQNDKEQLRQGDGALPWHRDRL